MGKRIQVHTSLSMSYTKSVKHRRNKLITQKQFSSDLQETNGNCNSKSTCPRPTGPQTYTGGAPRLHSTGAWLICLLLVFFFFHLIMLPLNYPLLPCFSKQPEQKVSSELRHLPTEETQFILRGIVSGKAEEAMLSNTET